MDFAIGDEVQITVQMPGLKYDVTKRPSKVEGMSDEGLLIVRPKHFRDTVEVLPSNVEMIKAIKRGRKMKLVGARKIMTKEVSIGGYGEVPSEARKLLEQVADIVDRKMGCVHGKTTLFWGLINEVNRHIDKKQFSRGSH